MLLRTERLTKDYGRFRALDALDLDVRPGEICGILGPNGSGKSTALRLVLGFMRPTAGHAWIAGHDCWHDSVHARRHVTYLPGELRLYENMTGRQLLEFLATIVLTHRLHLLRARRRGTAPRDQQYRRTRSATRRTSAASSVG